MVTIADVQKLFMNPHTDSIDGLLEGMREFHDAILELTDLNMSKLRMNRFSYSDEQSIDILARTSKLSDMLPVFEGLVRWHSPRTMFNVTPPPLLHSIAASAIASLYNPNTAWDIASGKINLIEQNIIKYFTARFEWSTSSAGGAFVFGGKGTNLYAIRSAVNAISDLSDGMPSDILVFSTKAGHPCHVSDTDWLGIGSKRCIRIDCTENGEIDLNSLYREFKKKYLQHRIPIIIINGGTTMDMRVDPISEVARVRDDLVKELGLSYVPHIHVDSVVGWPWHFFTEYDFKNNPHGFSEKTQQDLLNSVTRLAQIKNADSVGIDFHKTGFCQYASSLFVIKDATHFYKGTKATEYGTSTPFKYTLENSRPATGIISAYIALKTLGVEGFQVLIGHLTEIKNDMESKLIATEKFDVINSDSHGLSIVFVPKFSANDLVDKIRSRIEMDNCPYFIDRLPAYSTGSHVYDKPALKLYFMSPFSSRETNTQFLEYILNVANKCSGVVSTSHLNEHPLKS